MSLDSFFSHPENLPRVLAIVGAGMAMLTDMRGGKIYNWLTFPMILAGLLLGAYSHGLQGLKMSVIGALAGILPYFFLAIFGIIGMGDVKLMGGLGALAGPKFAFTVLLYTSVLGIPHGLLIQYLNYGKDAPAMLLTSYTTRTFLEKTILSDNTKMNYHFYLGIDIFLGTILATFLEIPLFF